MTVPSESWVERAVDRSAAVQRSRTRIANQVRLMLDAARRLIGEKDDFTTQELVAEAGVALQTFYRYFSGKDFLLLAVIEDIIDESCDAFREQAATLPDPIERLEFYVTATVRSLGVPRTGPSFITVEHFRLQTLYPAEISQATQPFTDLLVEEIRAAVAIGLLHTQDPDYAAWLITQLTMAVFHHYDCAGLEEPTDVVAAKLWGFCLTALGASDGPR